MGACCRRLPTHWLAPRLQPRHRAVSGWVGRRLGVSAGLREGRWYGLPWRFAQRPTHGDYGRYPVELSGSLALWDSILCGTCCWRWLHRQGAAHGAGGL